MAVKNGDRLQENLLTVLSLIGPVFMLHLKDVPLPWLVSGLCLICIREIMDRSENLWQENMPPFLVDLEFCVSSICQVMLLGPERASYSNLSKVLCKLVGPCPLHLLSLSWACEPQWIRWQVINLLDRKQGRGSGDKKETHGNNS